MPISTSPDTLEHRIGETGEFALRLLSGDIEIRGVDGDTVRVRDRDGGDLAKRFTMSSGDDRLELRADERLRMGLGFGLRNDGGSASIAVEVPVSARVTIETASADTRASGLRRDQRYRTASGSVDLESATGSITIDAVSGDVTVDLAGDAQLTGRSVSGDVTVRGGRLGAMALSTTSGEIEVHTDLAGPGPFTIQTVSGDVSISTATGLRVEARTLTGDISTDAPRQSGSGRGQHVVTLGDGATPLAFKSISGDLRLSTVLAARGAAVSPAAPAPLAPPLPVTQPWPPESPPPAGPAEPDARASERLAVLRDLEQARIDIDTASQLLAALEDDGR